MFLVLLAKVYIRNTGTPTYIPNLAISRIPFDVPSADIFLFVEKIERWKLSENLKIYLFIDFRELKI